MASVLLRTYRIRSLPLRRTHLRRRRPLSTATPPAKLEPLSPSEISFISSALRVNLAGEQAAVDIYASQIPPLVSRYPSLRPLMNHMYSQEASHHAFFRSLVARHRVRPTVLDPVWRIAATALGWSTAVMGREAAMACTEAVETEIGAHYNAQVRRLVEMADARRKRAAELGDAESERYPLGKDLDRLAKELSRIRDEELEHLDSAVEHDARKARGYDVLSWGIRLGCRGAIWLTKRL